MTLPWIKAVCLGVAGPLYWTVKDHNCVPYPAWVALRTAGLMIDGAEYQGKLKLAAATGHAFKKGNEFVTVLWCDADTPVQVQFENDVSVVDLMDGMSVLPAREGLSLDRTPVFVVGRARVDPLLKDS